MFLISKSENKLTKSTTNYKNLLLMTVIKKVKLVY